MFRKLRVHLWKFWQRCFVRQLPQRRITAAPPNQRAAGTPAALHLCGSYIPDPTGVEQCLRQNISGLSGACRSMFEPATRAVASSQ